MWSEFKAPLPEKNDWERQEQERNKQSGLQEQEIKQLKNTSAQKVFYSVVGIVLLLLLIVGILGATIFHFW